MKILDFFISDFETKGTIAKKKLHRLIFPGVIRYREYYELLHFSDAEIYNFLKERKQEFFGDLLKPEIKVSWTYTDGVQLRDFQIYRSVGGSAISLYKTIPSDGSQANFSFTDTDILKGNRYVYQVAARHTDGGFSMLSEVKMIKVKK